MAMVQIHSLTPSDSVKRPESSQKSLDEKLKDTLLDEAQFELFMDWMYSEFSCEIMLSVIEYVQFKAVLDEYEQSTDTAEEIIFYVENQ